MGLFSALLSLALSEPTNYPNHEVVEVDARQIGGDEARRMKVPDGKGGYKWIIYKSRGAGQDVLQWELDAIRRGRTDDEVKGRSGR